VAKGKSGRRNVKVLAVLSRELGGDPLLLFPIYEKREGREEVGRENGRLEGG